MECQRKKFRNFFWLWIKFHMHRVVPNWFHHPQVIWALVQKPESWGLMKKLTKKSLKIFLLKNLWKCTTLECLIEETVRQRVEFSLRGRFHLLKSIFYQVFSFHYIRNLPFCIHMGVFRLKVIILPTLWAVSILIRTVPSIRHFRVSSMSGIFLRVSECEELG